MQVQVLNLGGGVHFELISNGDGELQLMAIDPENGRRKVIYIKAVHYDGYNIEQVKWTKMGQHITLTTKDGEEE